MATRPGRYQRLALRLVSVLGFLLGWEALLSVVRGDPFFITKPSLVARAAGEQLIGGRLGHDIMVRESRWPRSSVPP